MQTFAANDAMSHFLSLKSTVDYYLGVMGAGLRMLDSLPLHAIELRYEDLVEETETQARRLLEFLDLPWDDAVLHFYRKAATEHINTPSYDQVTRPVYASAMGRWTKYRAKVGEAFQPLHPMIKRFSYEQQDDYS